ncbi:MAG TPA: hypothetical protein VKH37_13850 [Ferruginibacter sp.]|nr:hypothetical protein [Ferruginibacter sp.]
MARLNSADVLKSMLGAIYSPYFFITLKTKTMKFKFVIAFMFLLAIGINAGAQTRTGNQQRRIRQGVKSGELTKPEARNLEKQEKEIRQEKRAARADGVVTPVEKREIRQDERQTSRTIYRKKHNGRTRS